MCMCVHEGGSRSRACSGKCSRKSATLCAQVRACAKSLESPLWLHSYTPVSRIANTTRQMINESAALGRKKKKRGFSNGPVDLFHRPSLQSERHVQSGDKIKTCVRLWTPAVRRHSCAMCCSSAPTLGPSRYRCSTAE